MDLDERSHRHWHRLVPPGLHKDKNLPEPVPVPPVWVLLCSSICREAWPEAGCEAEQAAGVTLLSL